MFFVYTMRPEKKWIQNWEEKYFFSFAFYWTLSKKKYLLRAFVCMKHTQILSDFYIGENAKRFQHFNMAFFSLFLRFYSTIYGLMATRCAQSLAAKWKHGKQHVIPGWRYFIEVEKPNYWKATRNAYPKVISETEFSIYIDFCDIFFRLVISTV